MKNKIKKILLKTLTSNYDSGNIDDGGITGADNAVDQLYDLFVDEMITIDTATATLSSRPESKEPKDIFSCFAGTVLFPERETEKPKKLAIFFIPIQKLAKLKNFLIHYFLYMVYAVVKQLQ